ncbi:MAG: tRNA uridine-5-carboxymethylaminomethyl(34) synthesis GTPase MnmE [Methylicorpusculum sp.]|uniref:tRNA uridine-5-carboxymethylaminomethyl(34) synthesis GTPase MnmE n=1 Tax=Methylicorpusculum sp. TaxID=2713644 RepID=UPI0027268F97|nr:tRNA uridine-5-carboxymethylaminomethyl(34) synthesis GTPase MnmE [Methylicorpusculum sp.]MDO8844730.1 tRNA uridine-5-carboxymethylaminomethyl(34) synthesis GTPase MnmE [Methylicorpusculum sp.]MDO8938741.1 tRNA uridine-5-carboxymethylaminomethyl(34) synthesis GTPase MnmE [Methylicorpusculum sp.]MDP2201213.1 tRNA uridine-5-carboxymethylaminomethyl(34) synthesis GTPase MnmE [Methylicorpusculum sp.]
METITVDTIAAIATPPGNGGVGIIRVSGSDVTNIAKQIINRPLKARFALFTTFSDEDGSIIDSGITLYFPAPASYTGEDVLELQAHGGAIILDILLKRVLSLGARMARPGEFTERAFLNNKIDLAQAEAVADLIESSTEQSARSAQKSLQGLFSRQINEMVNQLTELRAYVEAAIDFVDEEIDFLSDGMVESKIENIANQIQTILNTAYQGRLLRDGYTIVLAGKPNAGKSSLLNALAGHDAAIVTDIAGTTRDVLREKIQIDGMPLHIIDTAGLRESDNPVEKEGIRRAHEEIKKADEILLLIDVKDPEHQSIVASFSSDAHITKIYNKIDLLGIDPEINQSAQGTQIYLSLRTGQGMELLKQHLKESAGFKGNNENVFIARRRHIEALQKSLNFVQSALMQLKTSKAGELVAEDLKLAQQGLTEITGEFSSDDLLGKIFSSFCIGK